MKSKLRIRLAELNSKMHAMQSRRRLQRTPPVRLDSPHMSARLREIPIIFLPPRSQGKAVATGNNAAWHCCCPEGPLLIGRTGGRITTWEGCRVECPSCRRSFAVHPSQKDQGPAERVFELA